MKNAIGTFLKGLGLTCAIVAVLGYAGFLPKITAMLPQAQPQVAAQASAPLTQDEIDKRVAEAVAKLASNQQQQGEGMQSQVTVYNNNTLNQTANQAYPASNVVIAAAKGSQANPFSLDELQKFMQDNNIATMYFDGRQNRDITWTALQLNSSVYVDLSAYSGRFVGPVPAIGISLCSQSGDLQVQVGGLCLNPFR